MTASLISSNRERYCRRVSIHGKPGAGKTIGAISMVEDAVPLLKRLDMDKGQLAKEKWTKINALWVSADTNATEGARVRKIEVPDINASRLFDESPTETLETLKIIADNVYEYVEKHKPQLVCVDTASKIDKSLARFWEDNAPRGKSGGRDGFAVWRSMVTTHERFHSDMNGLPCDVIFLMHSKPRSESDTADKRARAQSIAGQLADIRFDFMYEDAANIYRRDCDLILVADKLKSGGGFEYALFNEEHGGFEAKSRYGNLIPPKITKPLWTVFQELEK